MIAIEINENDFLYYDEDGCGWYHTEHERQFSDTICEITQVEDDWDYCPGCGRNLTWTEV